MTEDFVTFELAKKLKEKGLFEIKQQTINKPDGSIIVTSTTKVTGRGQIYFVNKFLKQEVDMAV